MDTTVTVLVIVASLKGVACQFGLFGASGRMSGFGGMGSMDFMNPFGGTSAIGDPFGMGMAAAPAPIVDPVAAREAHLTMAEERLGELLTESGANDPARQRVERMLSRSGGTLTGEAAPLNYLIQDYYMTTPGPVPPPNPQPSRLRQTNNYPPGGQGNPERGPMGPGGGPRGPGGDMMVLATGMQGVGQPSQSSGGWSNRPKPSGGAPTRRRRPGRRNRGRPQGNRPTTTAPPDWEQWLFNTQTKKPRPQANRRSPPRQRPSQNQQAGGSRWSSPPHNRASQSRGSALPRRPTKSGPPPLQNPNQRGTRAYPSPQTPSKTAPPPAPPKRTSIAVERLKNIQQRIDKLLNSQGGGGSTATSQQLAALRQIRDILSGKRIKRPSVGGTSPPGPTSKTKSVLPSSQSNPPYETNTGNQQPQRRAPPTNPPLHNSVASQRTRNNAGLTAVDFSPFGKVSSGMMPSGGRGVRQMPPGGPSYGNNQQSHRQHGSPSHSRQGMQQAPDYGTNNQGAQGQGGGGAGGGLQVSGPPATTVAPKLGDVRYIGNDKYVYTDADGYETFQWIKATPGPPPEQQQQQQQQTQPKSQPQHNQQQQGQPPA